MKFDKDYIPFKSTGAISDNGKKLFLGDEVELIFHEGDTVREHTGKFEVVWYNGGFYLKSEIGLLSSLNGIAENVKVIK